MKIVCHPRVRGPVRIRQYLTSLMSVVLMVGCGEQPAPTADPDVQSRLAASNAASCAQRVNNTVDKLLECVTIDGVRAHQAALQAIADANNGTRVSGTAGYDQSVQYVVGKLQSAGYNVTVQPFQFQAYLELAPTLLEKVAPAPTGPITTDIMTYSGSGDVTASVSNVAAQGCNAADFAGFPAGNIALIERSVCTFALKATNAYNAGAVAVVIYNNVPGLINGTLEAAFTLNIPVVATTQADGEQLVATPGLILRVRTSTFRGLASSANVITETADGSADNVVMLGAHLDGVSTGPGINDNGSSSAAILETALQMARVKPRNKVRFAWWGAEESGLIGSRYYVNTLPPTELNRLAMYLNFDMIGSPNHVFFVYDGDDSDAEGHGPYAPGSGAIEGVFQSFYASRSLPYQGVELYNSSDHTPFIDAGVPSGGLFTGASGIKTPAQQALWGGTSGVQFDPCYHLACDTFNNVNLMALETNADAVAFAALTFGMNSSLVNNIKGKGNFKANPNGAPNHPHGAVAQ